MTHKFLKDGNNLLEVNNFFMVHIHRKKLIENHDKLTGGEYPKRNPDSAVNQISHGD